MWKTIKGIAEFIGIVQAIWGAYGMMFGKGGLIYSDAKSNFNITYEFLYSGMFSIGVVTILYCLLKVYPIFLQWIYSFEVHPNTSIKEALEYIVHDSNFGKSLQDNQHGRDDAVKAIKDLILNKKITLFGTNDSNPTFKEISTKEINDNNLKIYYIKNASTGKETVHIAYVSNKDNDGEMFKNLSVSKIQLEKNFPDKYSI